MDFIVEKDKLELNEIYRNNQIAVCLCDEKFQIVEVNEYIIKNEIGLNVGFNLLDCSANNAAMLYDAMGRLEKGLPVCSDEFEYNMSNSSIFFAPMMKNEKLNGILCCIELQSEGFQISKISNVPIQIYQNYKEPTICLLNALAPVAHRFELLGQYDQIDQINDIVNYCYKMLRVSDEITLYYQLLNKKAVFKNETKNLNTFVDGIIDAISFLQVEYKRKIVFENSAETLFAKFDEKYLSNALFNIIANAFLYSIKESSVKINLIKDNDVAKIIVVNEGNPIQKVDYENIFLPFYSKKQQAVNCENDSLGLGLSIAKLVMEELSGNVDISSDENAVTTVVLTLPLSNGENEASLSSRTTKYLSDKFSPLYVIFSDVNEIKLY